MPDKYHTVCITGGSGFFGQAMTRHILATTTDTVVRCLSRGEWLQKQAAEALEHHLRARWFLGDVRDRQRLETALRGADLVIHAAAQKHVDACEMNPNEAMLTNTTGSMHVASAAIAVDVGQAIFLSSDKAVAPTTVYGASKLLAEKAWVQQNVYSPHGTRFSSVRYGNVAGSRGSVLEVFAQRLAQGLPLKITDPDATRFWMSIHEAVALVDWVAQHQLRGGVVIPQLPAFTMRDLVEAISICQGQPISTEIIGLRPAEKKHEVLALPEELAQATWYAPSVNVPVFYVVPAAYRTWEAPCWDEALGGDVLGQPVRGEGPLYTSYSSETTPWRLDVDDLVTKLQAMRWGT